MNQSQGVIRIGIISVRAPHTAAGGLGFQRDCCTQRKRDETRENVTFNRHRSRKRKRNNEISAKSPLLLLHRRSHCNNK